MCVMNDCNARPVGRGLCKHHYYRMRYEGRLEEFDGPKVDKDSPQKIAQRLYRLSKTDSNGCWIFQGRLDRQNNGRLWFGNKAKRAHRVSYELSNGPIPNGKLVCHRCDQPSCVNPDHLFLGDHQDNQKDCFQKERKPRGESHWRATLTEDNVRYIRSSYKNAAELARELNTTYAAVWQAKKRLSWRHIR